MGVSGSLCDFMNWRVLIRLVQYGDLGFLLMENMKTSELFN